MATKDELINGIQVLVTEAKRVGGRLTEAEWSMPSEEAGWNKKQMLAHIAAVGGIVVPFMGNIAKAEPGADASANLDIDAMNAQLVGQRDGKSVAELITEIETNYRGVIDWLRGADDAMLNRTASFLEYKDLTLSDLMMQMVPMHGIAHLYRAAGGI